MNVVPVLLAVVLYNISLLSCEDQHTSVEGSELWKSFKEYLELRPEQHYAKAIKPWKSIQDYVEVRPGAFLFYWFYYADGTTLEAESKPLIIWIQGGPGLAASGIANFAEIGPLTMDMKPRNHTWVHGRNLLLIDHPVGTGFSYANDSSLYVKSDREAVRDLMTAIRGFFKSHKNFRTTPTYLIGQSYGSKLCPRLALLLHTYIKKKRVKMNFKGIGIGSGWVDPKLSSLAQPDFLYHMGVLDKQAYLKIREITREMCDLIDKKMYDDIHKLKEEAILMLYSEVRTEFNYNNINQEDLEPKLRRLTANVNLFVKPTLSVVNQSVTWNYLSEQVFTDLTTNFYQPSTKYIEALLNHTTLKIAVYNGNLDVVTPLAGASNWVHALKWDKAKEFFQTRRTKIRGKRNGYYKSVGRLSFWSVFGAGHWIPEDNPTAMEQILEHLFDLNEMD